MAQRSIIAAVSTLLMALQTIAIGAVFPIDEFKAFIKDKPTIEHFAYQLQSLKFKAGGIPDDEWREFELIFQNEEAFDLVERVRNRLLTVPVTRTSQLNPGTEMRTSRSPFNNMHWGVHGTEYWNTYTSNGIITTIVKTNKSFPNYGPAYVARSMLRSAYDALNMGIIDLRSNGVVWEGNSFQCKSNEFGFKMSGSLELDRAGVPIGFTYSIVQPAREYKYRTALNFDISADRPRFCPSEIKIFFVDQSTNVLLSHYHITKLVSSSRSLRREDVVVDEKLSQITNHYLYNEGKTFVQETNSGGKLTWTQLKSDSTAKASTRTLMVRISIIALSALSLFLAFKYVKQQKKHHEHNT